MDGLVVGGKVVHIDMIRYDDSRLDDERQYEYFFLLHVMTSASRAKGECMRA